MNAEHFTNIAPPSSSKNKAAARRERAARNIQTCQLPTYLLTREGTVNKEGLKQYLENKLTEFCGMCRRGTISCDNQYAVALNILRPAADALGKEHQTWLARFVSEGYKAGRRFMTE